MKASAAAIGVMALAGCATNPQEAITIAKPKTLPLEQNTKTSYTYLLGGILLIPIVAPAIGKLILDQFGWEAIFYVQLLFALIVAIWFWKRQVETLKPEYKIPFSG